MTVRANCLSVVNKAANARIVLTDAQRTWRVRSGSITVFSTTCEQGGEGARRPLCEVGPGQILMGFGSDLATSSLSVFGVVIEETQLEAFDSHSVMRAVASGDHDWAGRVERWCQALCSSLAAIRPPEDAMRLEGEGTLVVSATRAVAAGAVTGAWLEVGSGRVGCMGLGAPVCDALSGWFPLPPSLWLVAEVEAELRVASMVQIADAHALEQGLRFLYRAVVRMLPEVEARERGELSQQWEVRSSVDSEKAALAVDSLAAVLSGAPRGRLHASAAPLVAAARLVGEACGITIEGPRRSEDPSRLREPLQAVARASGARVRRVLLSGRWWQRQGGPLVGFLGKDRMPVALLQERPNRYQVVNPTTGVSETVTAAIAEQIWVEAYAFYRSMPPRKMGVVDLLRFAVHGQGRRLAKVVVYGMVAALLTMATPVATGLLVDTAIPGADRSLIAGLGGALVAVAIGVVACQLVQGLVLLRFETASDFGTQAGLWDRLLRLPVPFFRQFTAGDLQVRVMAVRRIRQVAGGAMVRSLLASAVALLNGLLLLYYSPKLALIAVGVAAVAAVVTTLASVRLMRLERRLEEIAGLLQGLMVELIGGVGKLRVAGATKRAFAVWAGHYSNQQALSLRVQSVQDHLGVFNAVLPTVAALVLFSLAAPLILGGGGAGLSTGQFLAFYAAFGAFVSGATGLSNSIAGMLLVVPLLKRAQPVLEQPPEFRGGSADPGRLRGAIGMSNVVFRYRDDGPLVLDGLSLSIEPGEFVALVGTSGCGKSTLMRLLLGFEQPHSGTVHFDGQDMAGLDLGAVRRQIGVVLQSCRVEADSIFENIACSRQISLQEGWEAADAAGFADDIKAMPMGMHTVVSEGGGNLSAGQRQRLLIARALVGAPRMLLFDEATSALDNRTQDIVTKSIEALSVTRVVIAHRLSTIERADRIVVLDRGRVVEQGSFAELLARDQGTFANLVRRQQTRPAASPC